MQTTLHIKTNNNNYLYDIKKKELLICNPLISALYSYNKKKDDILSLEELENQIDFTTFNLTIDEIEYYHKKYHYLKENGYFTNMNYSKLLQGTIQKDNVENQINHIKHIVFEVTDRCNLKCKYCTYGELYNNYDERLNKQMKFETVKNTIKYLHKNWQNYSDKTSSQSVTIGFYGGEPLLNMELIKKTVDYVKSLKYVKRNFSFNMTTNAFLLDKHMDYLVENNFRLLISLDGNKDNNSHRVLNNGNSSFDKIFKNLVMLFKKHPDYFNSNVNFNSVLHNKNSIESTHYFIHENFKKTPQISPISNSGVSNANKEEFINTYKNIQDDYNSMTNIQKIISERFINDSKVFKFAMFLQWKLNNVYESYNDIIIDYSNENRLPTGTCFPFEKKIFITVNGKILACERIGQKYQLGEVNENEIKIDFNGIAHLYNKYLDKIRRKCFSCYGADRCIQCLFQIDDIESLTKCPGFKDSSLFSNLISDDVNFIENYPFIYNRITNEVILK